MKMERTLFFACKQAQAIDDSVRAKLRHADCPGRNEYRRDLGDRLDEDHLCICPCHRKTP